MASTRDSTVWTPSSIAPSSTALWSASARSGGTPAPRQRRRHTARRVACGLAESGSQRACRDDGPDPGQDERDRGEQIAGELAEARSGE